MRYRQTTKLAVQIAVQPLEIRVKLPVSTYLCQVRDFAAHLDAELDEIGNRILLGFGLLYRFLYVLYYLVYLSVRQTRKDLAELKRLVSLDLQPFHSYQLAKHVRELSVLGRCKAQPLNLRVGHLLQAVAHLHLELRRCTGLQALARQLNLRVWILLVELAC